MKRSIWICLVVVAALVWALTSSAQGPRLPRPGSGKKLPAVFTVTPAAGSAILVNSRTGQSWWLFVNDVDRPAWLPISRFDDYQQAAEWLVTHASAGDAKPAVDVQLAFAKAELKKLRSEYGSRHPKVTKLRDSIRALDKLARKAVE